MYFVLIIFSFLNYFHLLCTQSDLTHFNIYNLCILIQTFTLISMYSNWEDWTKYHAHGILQLVRSVIWRDQTLTPLSKRDFDPLNRIHESMYLLINVYERYTMHGLCSWKFGYKNKIRMPYKTTEKVTKE